MDTIPLETQCKMFSYMINIGCCVRCRLRFLGSQNLEAFYDGVEAALQAKCKVERDNIVDKEEKACCVCLGILQDFLQKIAVERIIQAIEEGCYDESTFNCALTLPISHYLREQSIHAALAKQFELTDAQQIFLKTRTQNIKEMWKTEVLAQVEKKIGKRVVATPLPSPLLVEISFSYAKDTDDVYKFLNSKQKESRNAPSRKIVEYVLGNLTNAIFAECYCVPPPVPEDFAKIEQVTCVHGSVFIGGRYAKLSRELSQTPWFINGEKKMETSVQDLICGPMIELTKADSVKFLSSGREDVDVRNIHSGRPFAVELVNPRLTTISNEQLDAVVTKINDSTELVKIPTKLKILDDSDLKKLKQGENEKTKVYRALCTFKNTSRELINLEKLKDMKDLEITQKTPLRVLHRRPLVPRIRLIHEMRSRWLRAEELKKLHERYAKSKASDTSHIDNLFVLDVKTQAGTYVKEFVHGDCGRTKPSLCDILGGDFDIAALDVTGINLDWP